jgi:RNA polymerase sigma factor FliA
MNKTQEMLLLEKFAPMARRIALGFRCRLPASIETDDLVAAAMSGLWDAVRFHPEAATGFEHYAAMRVRGAVLDELRTQDWLPRRHRADVEEGKAFRVQVVYDVSEGQRLASDDDVESEVSRRMMARKLVRYLRYLLPRERKIVRAHYFRFEKFVDIGTGMGISEPRVSQIHAIAMGKLRCRVPRGLLESL